MDSKSTWFALREKIIKLLSTAMDKEMLRDEKVQQVLLRRHKYNMLNRLY